MTPRRPSSLSRRRPVATGGSTRGKAMTVSRIDFPGQWPRASSQASATPNGRMTSVLQAESPVEHARLLLLRDAQEEFSSTINSNSNKELLLRLPQYLRAETGSVVRLTLRRLSDPASTSNAIVLAWNDHILATNLIEPA